MKEETGIIFDMDGTLWDSSEGVALSWTQALARHPETGLSLTPEDIQGVMGMPMDAIARKLFTGLAQERQMALLDECCVRENEYLEEHGGILCPGLEETLQVLEKEYPLFIVSNCQCGYIEAFLSHYGFGHYFRDYACFGDNGYPKADNIRILAERNHLKIYYYVGDIQADYDATMAAGGRFIHAAYGFGTVSQIVPAIHALPELPALLHSLAT